MTLRERGDARRIKKESKITILCCVAVRLCMMSYSVRAMMMKSRPGFFFYFSSLPFASSNIYDNVDGFFPSSPFYSRVTTHSAFSRFPGHDKRVWLFFFKLLMKCWIVHPSIPFYSAIFTRDRTPSCSIQHSVFC